LLLPPGAENPSYATAVRFTLVCVKQSSVCAAEFPVMSNVPYDAVLTPGFRACRKKPRNCESPFPERVTTTATSYIISLAVTYCANQCWI